MSGYPTQQPQNRPGNPGYPGAPTTGGYGVGSPPDPYFAQTNTQNYPSYGSVTGGGYNHNQDGMHNSNSFNRSNPQLQHPNPHMNSSYNGVHTSPRAGPGGVGPVGVGGYDPYTRSPGVGGRGYDDEYNDPSSPPTDFDALFSGKSRPSIVVTGQAASQFPVGKASKVLGLDDPHNLVYENSGFSRTVHFDTSLPSPDDIHYNSAEVYAQKRRESIAQFPKKSKSKFVSKNKMNKNDRWLEWAEKTRMEAQIKKEEFVRKQEEAAKRQLPAPIKKARKESVKFVNHQYIPSDEETPLSKAMSTMPLPAAQQKQQSAKESAKAKRRKRKKAKKRQRGTLNGKYPES